MRSSSLPYYRRFPGDRGYVSVPTLWVHEMGEQVSGALTDRVAGARASRVAGASSEQRRRVQTWKEAGARASRVSGAFSEQRSKVQR